MPEQIIEALKKLDPNDDKHWTSEGLPRLDILAADLGVKFLKRGDVTKVAPAFTRANLETNQEVAAENVVASTSNFPEIELENAREILAKASAVFEEAKLKVDAAQLVCDKIEEEKAKDVHPHQNQLDIMQFLASQQKLREQRGSKAPIDQRNRR